MILDEFQELTGCHRKHLIRILQNESQQEPTKKKERRRIYDEGVKKVLLILWETTGRICSKRLKAIIPLLLESMEYHGHLDLSACIKEKLLNISASTIDRMLRKERAEKGKYESRRRKNNLQVRKKVPIRRFTDWVDPEPGFLEADFVAHCGGSLRGKFIHTLTVTDVATGWTVCLPLLYRDQSLVLTALREIQLMLPFKIRGLDTDNDSTFINNALIKFCEANGITQTRSRPYKSNDQALVEQKNKSVVRRLVGYGRYEGIEAAQKLSNLFAVANSHINFFLPSFKLVEKTKEGKRYKKIYDTPKTPLDRLFDSGDLSEESKSKLLEARRAMDPVDLAHKIYMLQNEVASISQSELEPSEGGKEIELEDFLEQLPVLWKSGEVRPTHRKKPRPPRHWRTRHDPFETYWDKVFHWLEQDPDLSANMILQKLLEFYPDSSLSKAQLRTLQRRIKEYREEMAEVLIFGIKG